MYQQQAGYNVLGSTATKTGVDKTAEQQETRRQITNPVHSCLPPVDALLRFMRSFDGVALVLRKDLRTRQTEGQAVTLKWVGGTPPPCLPNLV